MTHVAPRIVNSVSCVKRIDHESHFAWQVQYLVKFKGHFSWQAQHSVKFGMIVYWSSLRKFRLRNFRYTNDIASSSHVVK